jgi:hypothetical protein
MHYNPLRRYEIPLLKKKTALAYLPCADPLSLRRSPIDKQTLPWTGTAVDALLTTPTPKGLIIVY